MKKTIATIAVTVLSFVFLAGCGSNTDPSVKSPATDTSQKDRAAVAKAATNLFVNLTAESQAFEQSKQPTTFETFDKAFPKTLAAVDLSSFETKIHAYEAVSADGLLLTLLAAQSPEVSVSNLVTIKDFSKIKVTGDTAVFNQDIVPVFKDMGVEDVTFNRVNGTWLLDGKKYTDAYFKVVGLDLNDSTFQ